LSYLGNPFALICIDLHSLLHFAFLIFQRVVAVFVGCLLSPRCASRGAWQLKEELRTWYATATLATAAQELDGWIEKVQTLGCEPLRKTLSAFKNWRHEILAFFQFLPTRLSNGFVEGKNNRTKALMRQGYGYRNRHHLRLRILLGEVA